MFTYKKENQLPIKSWIPKDQYFTDEKMVEQVENLAKLPFAFSHIVLSPDGHVGYGMPIGGVLATENVIIPNAVGVDIGCGMCAVRTSLTEIDTKTLKKIIGEIRKVVPVGFNKHEEKQYESLMPKHYVHGTIPIVFKEWDNACFSLGTLGGGNHFIEIQKGSDGYIWIMIHSGSRNLGKQVADHYNKIAVDLNAKWHSSVPKECELAFLPIDSKQGQAYIREMNYCVEFALVNRKLMMKRIEAVLFKLLKAGFTGNETSTKPSDEIINIAHNYASLEHHFGKNVMVHRKGATLAREGTIGIIPGSQGTKSYIVKGLGNKDSFMSCSHGAGRKMGRKEAHRTLDLKEEIKLLDDMGVVHGIRSEQDLDEAPSAYKNIDEVMENQKDLVEILVELKPLAVIKG